MTGRSASALLFLLWIGVVGTEAFAQSNATLRGKVVDSISGEVIPGAVARVGGRGRVRIANDSGLFVVENLLPGPREIRVQALGYVEAVLTVDLVADRTVFVLVEMREDSLPVSEILVQAQRIKGGNSVSDITLDADLLREHQGLLEDPIRTITSLPGVSGGTDLFNPSAVYVRGGAPEENLFLLDQVKLYWPWYFGGMKSIYNTDVIDRIELMTGGFPVSFGNHMSSVLNVTTRSGDFQRWHGGASIGFFNAGALVEGPVVTDDISILAAVRRTYLDLFLSESAEFPVPSFGDITFKGTARLGDRHHLTVSGISSDESIDFLAAEPEPGLPDRIETDGSTHAQSGRWLAALGANLVSRLAVTHAQSRSSFAIGHTIDADIKGETWGIREDVEWRIADGSRVEAGFEGYNEAFAIRGSFPLDPSETDPNDTTILLRPFDLSATGTRSGAYALFDGNLVAGFGANAGVRIDHNSRGSITDFSPRLAVRYAATARTEVRAAIGLYHQFPADEALGYNPTLESAVSRHYILGFRHHFTPSLVGWIEAYVKDYRSLTVYDSLLNYTSDGTGQSRGLEVFLHKQEGSIQGWFSYALSQATRRTPLRDRPYPFDSDQRHIMNCAMNWEIGSEGKWYVPSVASVQIRFASGTPYTPVVAGIRTSEGWRPVKGPVNSERNPFLLNLNLRFEYRYKLSSTINAASFVEVWNLVNRKNLLGRSYRYGPEFENNVRAQPYYTTPLIVGGGFRFWF